MKQKKIVRAVCLFLAILMVVSVMGSVLVTMASAATVKRKNTVYTARQPDLTFYDIDGNLLGTFSHSAKSDLIGFNSTRVIYKDEEGQEIETNYGRVDVTLHLSDGTGKYSTMTQTREDSYYLRYNMGSTTGEAFSNRITCSKGSDDVIDLDIELPNVVFRDSNEMKMNVIFQYPSVRTSTSGKKTNVVKTRTTAVNFTFTKAKLDLTVTKPNNPLTDDEKDKEKDKTLSGTIREYNSDGTLVNKQSGSYNEPDTEKPEIAFAGKSNVGKSSLINGLMNRKALARTSSQPGKTQTINFYNVNDCMYLVDLPGYGYAKVPETEKAKWGKMIERYLHTSQTLKAVFLLIDIRHDPSANDKLMYDWIVNNGYNPIIIATKLDKLKRSQVQKNIKAIKDGLKLRPGSRIIPFSAET